MTACRPALDALYQQSTYSGPAGSGVDYQARDLNAISRLQRYARLARDPTQQCTSAVRHQDNMIGRTEELVQATLHDFI
jgi:hypothetical protein